jgi:hypothetical protein
MMKDRVVRHGVSRRVHAVWLAGLLAVCCSSSAIAAVSSSRAHVAVQTKLAGKWRGHYSGAFSGKFTIHWRQAGSELTGSIALSNPKGRYGISGSVRRGGKVKFGAVSVGATYKGTVRGKTMSGTWNSPQGGGHWSARKVS